MQDGRSVAEEAHKQSEKVHALLMQAHDLGMLAWGCMMLTRLCFQALSMAGIVMSSHLGSQLKKLMKKAKDDVEIMLSGPKGKSKSAQRNAYWEGGVDFSDSDDEDESTSQPGSPKQGNKAPDLIKRLQEHA